LNFAVGKIQNGKRKRFPAAGGKSKTLVLRPLCLMKPKQKDPKPFLVFALQAQKLSPSSAKKCRRHFLADATYIFYHLAFKA
jgi:hypothetical protein